MLGIVFCSVWGISEIKKGSESFIKLITEASELCDKGETELASERVKKAKEVWENCSRRISYLCDNADLKDISRTVAQLEYLVNSDTETFNLTCVTVKESISHLMEEELPDLDGVF